MNSKPFFLALYLSAFPTMLSAQYPKGGAQVSSNPSLDATSTDPGSRYGRPGDYLMGKVSLAGGLPWDAIPVTVQCDGKTKYTADADAKGQFVIAGPAGTVVANDASGNLGAPKFAVAFTGCTVQAALAGFESSSVTVADKNVKDHPDLGTITLKPQQGSGGSAVSATTAAAPKDATKAFEKARAEWLDRKPDKAQKDLEKAVQVDPQFAEAWYQLGKLQEAANSPEASASFSKAAAADPKYIPPYEHLGRLGVKAEKWQEVADATGHELELDPRGTAEIWFLNAYANYKLGKKDVAEAAVKKSLEMDPLHTQVNAEQLLAVMLADKQDFAGALAHLKNVLTYLPAGPSADVVKQQIAQLEQMVPAAK